MVGLELLRLWKAYVLAATEGVPGVSSLLPGLLGMVCSAGAGMLALAGLSAALERGRWQYFGYYCVLASGAIGLRHILGLV